MILCMHKVKVSAKFYSKNHTDFLTKRLYERYFKVYPFTKEKKLIKS